MYGSSCEMAWLAAAEHLIDSDEHAEYNLVVEIAKPAMHDDADHRIRNVVDTFLRERGAHPLSTVAGTIFPASEYLDHGRRGVYDLYPDEVFPVIKSGWGSYAYRLVRWPSADGTVLRPLETLVEKMKVQLANGKRMRACYELSISDSGIDLPLYDPAHDRNLTRSGPCLSHVSFKLGVKNTLYLTALYRSHTYVGRALGNFLGLAALQAFVCNETGLEPGPLVCVSTYARLEVGEKPPKGLALDEELEDKPMWSQSDAIDLVRAARAAIATDTVRVDD